MKYSLEISWHHVDKSQALESEIRRHAEKLEEFYDGIISCRVAVEKPHGSHRHGNLYNIKIILKVPDDEIVAVRNHGDNHAHEDPYVSVRDAFAVARRQLEEYAEKRREH